jgi:hypothetical protein
MKVFKNRKFAILITIAIVVLATLLGVRGSLNRLARDTEAMFYNGVYLKEDGYTQPGIDSQLSKRLNSALGFALLMENHPELEGESSGLLSAQRELQNAKSIREKYSANESMQRAFVKLSENAAKMALSSRETEAIEQYTSTFMGAQTLIQNSRYNQQASSFMDNASFLAQLIKPFLFVKSPQIFG